MPEAVHIDGSLGEGGGQILRTSLALAALLRQPVKIDNIRANRPKPGLKTQHLAGVLALAKITDAEVKGANKHSTSLLFAPRSLRGGKYRFEITTAGAASMLFGSILPALLYAPQNSEVTITGGTHVPFSPPFHYLDKVFLPALRKLGGKVELELAGWGFYPKGGGEIRARVKPCKGLQGLKLKQRGKLQDLQILACSSTHLPEHIAQREICYIEKSLEKYKEKIRSLSYTCQSFSPGNFVFLEAEYADSVAGFSALGRRGKPAEEVADEACRAFRGFEGTAATLDSYLADQLILYMALAKGESAVIIEKATSHLMTNIDIIKKFLQTNIELDPGTNIFQVAGCGYGQI
jgi:RNA 3'-terminal phosphate cyclase (ATP)